MVIYILYILSAFFIAVNKYTTLAFILLFFIIVLDGVDGAIARLKHQTSFLGIYFEYTFHETGPPLVFFALGSHLYVTLKNPVYLYLGGIIVISQLLINSFGTSKQRIMYEYIKKKGKVLSTPFVGSSLLKQTKNPFLAIFIGLINVPPNFAFSSGIITIGYIFRFLEYVLIFYFIYFCFVAFFKVVVELVIGFKPYGLK